MAGYLHRTATTAYPCCIPALGRFSRSWSCKTCRCKDKEFAAHVWLPRAAIAEGQCLCAGAVFQAVHHSGR